jgi:hypothetical protein
MSSPLVGIIANPASGRDIRRLVAHGTVFDNNEKAAIVRRMLLGLEAVGIRRVAYMPEHDFGILPRALTELHSSSLQLTANPLEMPVLGTSIDSTRAARLLVELGAGCIITLGGDGTNRAVAKGTPSRFVCKEEQARNKQAKGEGRYLLTGTERPEKCSAGSKGHQGKRFLKRVLLHKITCKRYLPPLHPFLAGCFSADCTQRSVLTRLESWVNGYPASRPRRRSDNWFRS